MSGRWGLGGGRGLRRAQPGGGAWRRGLEGEVRAQKASLGRTCRWGQEVLRGGGWGLGWGLGRASAPEVEPGRWSSEEEREGTEPGGGNRGCTEKRAEAVSVRDQRNRDNRRHILRDFWKELAYRIVGAG